ncbi:726_t:CDS:2 [Diversispora eburnea]|uniref:726_t:CDS:1 n=1 Tax=Diversispora eburnea TaxID=1213867 RepID=A0A9N9B087_9GLOM|nr:726_t:CDS:2 [Diversispora eburnea]
MENMESLGPMKVANQQPDIRLEIPLVNRYNNIVYFPDLLKKAGIEIKKTPRYVSGSDTELSDFEAPDDLQLTKDSNNEGGFFERILENAEIYAEQEKNNKKRKTRGNKKEQQYDTSDPFIDDSELVPLQRNFGKARPQIDGYFVWQGPLEIANQDEEDEEQPKKKTKRKQKSTEEGAPKVRRKRTSKKTEETGADNIAKQPPAKKKRGSRKAAINNESQKESQLMTESSLNSLKTLNEETNKMEISVFDVHSLTSEVSKTFEINKTPGKKKKIYSVESVNPEVQRLLNIFKQQIEKESFEVKSKFPPNLKNPLTDILVKAYELNQFNENLFKILTNMLPYNKFTITRLCQRTLYPKTLIDIQKKKAELIEQLKNAVDAITPRSDSSLNNRPSKDSFGKKFRWDDTTRRLLWRIVQEEMAWVSMSNELNEADEKSERHSEQTCRKSLYQALLKIWPTDWMTSYEIARVYSAYKRYLRDRVESC